MKLFVDLSNEGSAYSGSTEKSISSSSYTISKDHLFICKIEQLLKEQQRTNELLTKIFEKLN